MSTGLTIVFLIIVLALLAWAWWKLFNTPAGERYLKMRMQGPFVPVDSDDTDDVQKGEKAS